MKLNTILSVVSIEGDFDNVDVPNLVTSLLRKPIFEWYMIRCDSKNIIPKGHMFKRD